MVTHGTFELDGGSWEVDNNIWIVGDDSDVVVFDAAHVAEPIVQAVGGRNVVAVVCTHGHNDHVTVARSWARRSTPGAAASRRRGAVADDPSGQGLSRGGRCRHRQRRRDAAARVAHPGPLARIGLLVRPGAGSGVQRRHPVPGRTRCDGPLVLRLPDHPAVDLEPARHAACRHGRLHRPRRHHHRRR
ncbi:metallo-beta-lactamase superfamily protein [Mycobacterium xenopi 3993]|nr:metallo-beta-lactamase superfamily protein [Mycobacterium xenopi 3993]